MGLQKTLTHLFFPHESNNHRAKVLHLDAMIMYLLAFAVFNFGLRSVSQKFPDVLGYATNIQVERLLVDTNQKRKDAGLGSLSLNQQLSQAAAGKAADMFGKNYWAHVAPDGKTPWDFIVGAGYKYTVAGENLAKNFQDSDGVVNAWMASPSHRDNLLKSTYKEVGFAVVNGKLQGEDTTLVVQMFGTRPNAKPLSDASDQSIVPQVQAAAPVVPEAVKKPVVVPEVASATQGEPETTVSQIPFASVISLPKFDVPTVRRDVTMLFGGMIVGVLLLDLWVAARKRTVRAVGSTVAHVFFFVAILISTNMILHGTIL